MTSRLDSFTDAAFAFAVSRGIWLIMALTGGASILVSLTAFGVLAAMIYTTLPLTIGLFVWRHDWEGKREQVSHG